MEVFEFEAPPILYWNSNVYALQFSPDGTRLAVGSGGWYGGGGITVVDVRAQKSSTLRFGDCKKTDQVAAPWTSHKLTISGVCFDGSGRHLVLSSWSSSQRAAPTFVCEVDGLELSHVATLETTTERRIWRRCPTGVGLLDGQVVVRCNARRVEDVLLIHPAPAGVDTDAPHAAHAHARMAIVNSRIITGGGGSLKLGGWSAVEGNYESHKAAEGLLVFPDPIQARATNARVTAVLATADGGLITGGLDGALNHWSLQENGWTVDRILREAKPRKSKLNTSWATYRPESIIGLCRLDSDRWFSVDAGGQICGWTNNSCTDHFDLHRTGTPRTIAVHPQTPIGPLLAVGVKGDEDERRGFVACFKV